MSARFLVFSGYNHHPIGGWLDFVGDAAGFTEALVIARREVVKNDWVQVVDTETLRMHEIDREELMGKRSGSA